MCDNSDVYYDEEWKELILEALRLGITSSEIKNFLLDKESFSLEK